jgi:hypothetical protein
MISQTCLQRGRRDDLVQMWRNAYRVLVSQGADFPLGGRGTLGRLAPALRASWDAAEETAERVASAYVAGTASVESARSAVQGWVEAVSRAQSYLTRVCHDCGEDRTAVVVSVTGRRLCRRCRSESAGPIRPRA